MTEREMDIKREITTCRHFNGIQHAACRCGVVYRDLFGNEAGWAKHLCCLGDKLAPIACPSMSTPTREEAEALVDKHAATLERFGKAHKAAKADAKTKGLKVGNGGTGQVKCPNCDDGEIYYSVASVNGHMHAACSTPDCVSWME